MAGILIMISSPSGGGKTSIIQKILETNSKKFIYSISATTRKSRPGEVHGQDYFFLSEKQFKNDINLNRFLEWEEVHGYYYGTKIDFIEGSIKKGKYILMDIDVNGALRVAKNYRGKLVTIFIAPPSTEELIERLKARKTDSELEINKRLKRLPMEIEKSKEFDFIVVNKTLHDTVNNVIKIIDKLEA